jgi:hypothetical protein
MEERVLEARSGDLHPEFIADGEVAGRHASRVMVLPEEDRLPRPMQTSPFCDATFKRATGGIGKLTGMVLSQPCEQRLRPEPGLNLQTLPNIIPDILEGIAPRAIRASRCLPRRQPVAVPIFASRFLAHLRHPCRIGQRPAQSEQSPKFLDASIRDHCNLHEHQELQSSTIFPLPWNSNYRSARTTAKTLKQRLHQPVLLIVANREN